MGAPLLEEPRRDGRVHVEAAARQDEPPAAADGEAAGDEPVRLAGLRGGQRGEREPVARPEREHHPLVPLADRVDAILLRGRHPAGERDLEVRARVAGVAVPERARLAAEAPPGAGAEPEVALAVP